MISEAIMSLTKVHIYPNDGLPNTICLKCFEKLEKCIKFIKDCKTSQLRLRKLIGDFDPNESESISSTGVISLTNTSTEDVNQYQSVDKTKNNKISNKEDNLNDVLEESNPPIIKSKTIKPQCFTCGRVLSSRSRLITHLLTHSGEKSFSCTTCNKSFTLKQNLSVHMRTHTGEKPHQCTICGEKFSQSSGLSTHKRKHTGRKPYQCTVCPKSFITWGHLQYHIRKHTGEKKFECDVCSRCFIARNDLKRHSSTHTGIKSHVCFICGMQMARAYHLKRHMKYAHGKDKKISCNGCSASFCKKADLERHLKGYCVPKDCD